MALRTDKWDGNMNKVASQTKLGQAGAAGIVAGQEIRGAPQRSQILPPWKPVTSVRPAITSAAAA